MGVGAVVTCSASRSHGEWHGPRGAGGLPQVPVERWLRPTVARVPDMAGPTEMRPAEPSESTEAVRD